jgi:hypothetical protein
MAVRLELKVRTRLCQLLRTLTCKIAACWRVDFENMASTDLAAAASAAAEHLASSFLSALVSSLRSDCN